MGNGFQNWKDGDRPRRVLIVRIGAMGDVLHAMPAVAALRKAHPDWFISWAIKYHWRELLQASGGGDMPLVDGYIVPTLGLHRRTRSWKTLGEIRGLWQVLRAGQFDLCVDMQGLLKSAVVGRMAGARVFAGPENPREWPAEWFYSQRVPMSATHVIEQECELLSGAVGEVLQPAKVTLPVDELAEIWCDELLSRESISDSGMGRFVVIAPTAGWGSKQWSAEKYGAVAAELGRAGFRTLVNSPAPDNKVVLEVVKASEGFATMVACSIGEMIAMVRRAALVIAGDSGPLHLAAALGRPVVALFGPTDPARTGPYGTQSRVLRHASSRDDHGRQKTMEAGLGWIEVDEVTAAALELLQNERDEVQFE